MTDIGRRTVGRFGDHDALRAAAAVLGDRVHRHVPIGPLTTYGVGGKAALLLENCTPDDLALARRAVAASGIGVLVLGRGSNVLVSDRGYPGLVITLGEAFASLQFDYPTGAEGLGEPALVRAGGALSLPVLARRTAARGLRGMEWAVGVPGSVGGGVRMNAGGHGSEVAASLVRAWIFDLGRPPELDAPERGAVETPAADLALGYRRSGVGPGQIIVAAEFALTTGDTVEAEAEISAVVRWRREHQPGGSNAGSVFANPDGDSAGRLIDAAGLRGHRSGSAYVSQKHANFIQVDEGGSADDVRGLMMEVQKAVENQFGIVLMPENRLVGFEHSSLSES